MRAVILAGGRGTRLLPYTTVLPKPLMPLGDRPIVEIIIGQLRQHGFTDVTMAVGYLSHLMQAYFGNGERFGVQIRYSIEEQPLGTAGALTLIPDLTEPFLVMNGDVLTNLDFSDLYRYHCQQNAGITVSLYSKDVPIDLGVLELNQDSEVINYIEKPTFSYMVSMGIYVMSPEILGYFPRGQHMDLPDMVHRLLKERKKVAGYRCRGEWLDIGRPEDYARATAWVDALQLEQPSPSMFLVTPDRAPVMPLPAFDVERI